MTFAFNKRYADLQLLISLFANCLHCWMALVKPPTHILHSMWCKNDIATNFDILKYCTVYYL